jgi:hypothetical protein
MNMKKTIKKIAALATGAGMVGATLAGALALDLSDYPEPFVMDGVFDGKIVVGETAKTTDVMGAIDIAASLQAEAKTTNTVEVPGATGGVSATGDGDSYEFSTSSDLLEINEYLGDVRSTLLVDDLPEALQGATLDTGASSTPVKQYLRFPETGDSPLGGLVKYGEDNENDRIGDFLFFDKNNVIFEYEMEFTEGAESDIDSGTLEDLEGEQLYMIGAPFTIVKATKSGSTIELTLLGGEVADVLKDGETKTYTIDGKDYEVEAVFIDSSTSQSAKLSVNGLMTKELKEGETDVLSDEITIGVQDILTNQREGLVEFYLGANKLVISDSDFVTDDWGATVKKDQNTITDGEADIKASNTSTSVTLNSINYRLRADSDLYIAEDEGVKEHIEEEEGMFVSTWDIVYKGLTETGTTEVKFNPRGDDAYYLEFENARGAKYDFPFLNTKDTTFNYGDDDDNFVFVENDQLNNTNGTTTFGLYDNRTTFVKDDMYFLVTDKSSNDDKATVNVLRYKSLSDGDKTVTFEDKAGESIKVSYTGTPGVDAQGTLTVSGKDHAFYVGYDSATAADAHSLSIDLNGDGDVNGDEVKVVTKGGYVLDLGTQSFNDNSTGDLINIGNTGTVKVVMTTKSDKFDDRTTDELINVTFTDATTTLGIGSSSNVAGITLENDPDEDEWYYGMSAYGALFSFYNPSSSDDAETLTIDYPLVQRGAQVFVTAGSISFVESGSVGDGDLSVDKVNPIGTGLAIKDTDAIGMLGDENLLVVGGPCVNTVAAELLGNPEDCTADFTPGKSVIRFFEDQKALLVAGYEADDTLAASYVLVEYMDYADQLVGDAVEVVGVDLDALTVSPVTESEE